MAKYAPLMEHLKRLTRDRWSATFGEIERVLKFNLPPSAFKHDAWWSNSRHGNHSQARAWIDAGWRVVSIQRTARQVQFERWQTAKMIEAVSANDELWAEARVLSGIKNADQLERAVLESFIQREAGKRLIALGGTMPDFDPAPRR